MILRPPIEVTARLLPGVHVNDAFISIEYAGTARDDHFHAERTRYCYHIDLADGFAHSADDLQSAVGGGSLQDGLVNLLSFLSACGESYGWWLSHGRNGEHGENQDLFPPRIAEWAYQHSDELALLRLELEEAEQPLIEE